MKERQASFSFARAGAQVLRNLSSMSHGLAHPSGAMQAAANLDRFAGDERLAAIFKQMREIVGVSQSEMARRLGTNVSTLLDFEAGAVASLPSWPETVRIVDRYAQLSQIDPSPILSRLLQLQPAPNEPTAPRPILPIRPQMTGSVQALSSDASATTPPSGGTFASHLAEGNAQRRNAADVAPQWTVVAPAHNASPSSAQHVVAPPDDHAVGFDGRSRARETTVRSARLALPSPSAPNADIALARRRRRRRTTVMVVTPILTVVVAFAAMLLAPRPFYRLAKTMPAPIATPILAVLDTAVLQTAAVRDGLRWIELDDPRLRKGDRLKP